jgi:hypothetical protein
MSLELKDLKLTDRELERLTGWDVGPLFVGGVFGGIYRPSALRKPKLLASFCLTQLLVFLLTIALMLPISLALSRNSADGINQLPRMVEFLGLTVGLALLVMVGWNGYMMFRGRRLKSLMHLLDAVDRYHEVVDAIAMLDQLEAAGNPEVSLSNRAEVLAALGLTRDSLVAGMVTERTLRENRGLLARQQAMLSSIEANLVTLRTLEMKHQANEYGQVLNAALQIGLNVQQEMQKLSNLSLSDYG